MKNISEFFRTAAVSKLEFNGIEPEDLLRSSGDDRVQFKLPTIETADGRRASFSAKDYKIGEASFSPFYL